MCVHSAFVLRWKPPYDSFLPRRACTYVGWAALSSDNEVMFDQHSISLVEWVVGKGKWASVGVDRCCMHACHEARMGLLLILLPTPCQTRAFAACVQAV